jgi:hypothetical protein
MTAVEGEADSGHMPGAAETMGAGAAAQRAASSAALTGATPAGAEARSTTDTAEAGALADQLALRIGQFAVTQGWIPQTAVQKGTARDPARLPPAHSTLRVERANTRTSREITPVLASLR